MRYPALSNIKRDRREQLNRVGTKAWISSALAFGKTATIKSSGKDRYGWTLGYFFIEDQAINTMMVRMGMAWWYRRYDKTEELENAERYAKENKIDLWSDPSPIAPWDWRKGKR